VSERSDWILEVLERLADERRLRRTMNSALCDELDHVVVLTRHLTPTGANTA
jgi:hypothetical protein